MDEELIVCCANCNKLKINGVWVEEKTDKLLTHGICKPCAHIIYGNDFTYQEIEEMLEED